MFTASRISKKTFLAAAALGFAVSVPAFAADVDDVNPAPSTRDGYVEFDFSGAGQNKTSFIVGIASSYLTDDGVMDFVKKGSGDLLANVGCTGRSLYGLHYQWFDPNGGNFGVPEYHIRRDQTSGATVEDPDGQSGIPRWQTTADSESLMKWTSGEVRVEEGKLELVGYVNAWFNFGSVFNDYFDAEYGTAGGKMTGASRITIGNGAVIDLSGNNNLLYKNSQGGMVAYNTGTVYQFLHNLQAGDLGTASTATLDTGSSTMLHLGIHIDDWSENTRSLRADGSYLDNSLAFGGSVGVLKGSASVYKTGEGNLTLLNTSAGFKGDLYAAGGELTLQGDNSAGGSGAYAFKDASGKTVWKAKISDAFYGANSVNIAGTYNETGINGESRLGAVARGKEIVGHYEARIDGTDPAEVYDLTSPKEEYFARSSAATLVVSENQRIRNFQSYFNGGYAVSGVVSAEDAVLYAGSASLTWTRTAGTSVENIVDASPIIVGTGTGSKIVIPGGNYTLSASGEYTLNTSSDTGEMIGGVLLIEQAKGMGGVYAGSIVGCRVSIYDKTEFNANTEASKNAADAGTTAERLDAVKVSKSDMIAAAAQIGATADEIDACVANDGSFALDNATAWKIVNYYKKSPTVGDESHAFYIDYQADNSVTGGIVALDGAGDIAFLLEQSNFSGIHIAATRTGKTVLNISALNTLPGSVVAQGGNVSVISTQKDTLKTKLSFSRNAKLIFSSGETISTVARTGTASDVGKIFSYTDTPGANTILVGDLRKSVIAFALTQDLVLGDVYVERGIDLDFAGDESVFPNANSLTLWRGEALRADESEIAASGISLKGDGYMQTVNNLTGDDAARIDMAGHGALIVNATSNDEDAYSGLTRGTYAGVIRGEGSLVKGGSADFTLSGGEYKIIYTGTTEVGAGTLRVTASNGIARSSALILDAGTTVSAVGGQSFRNLFGAEGSTLSVSGELTVGSDAAFANGDNRPYLANNLGTSSSGNWSTDDDASFERFAGTYDLEGNRLNDVVFSNLTQAEATSLYLKTAAKVAYSGFDATALEKFVGVTNYDGSTLLTQEKYDEILAYAKKPGSGSLTVSWTDAGAEAPADRDQQVEISSGSVLKNLSDVYAGLTEAKWFVDEIGRSGTGVLRGFFGSTAEYNAYLRANGLDGSTAMTEQQRFEKIASCYLDLNGQKEDKELKAAFATEASAREKFAADFGNVRNLGGTAMLTTADQTRIDETLGAYGVALDAYGALAAEIEELIAEADAATTDEERRAIEERIVAKRVERDAAELVVNQKLEDVLDLYDDFETEKEQIADKSVFSGISIAGAFAGSVDTNGNLVNGSWTEDLAFAGTLDAASLTKVGDNTLTLTGAVKVSAVHVQGGVLSVLASKLPATLAGGITVDRGADLVVETSGTGTTNFDYSLTGYGNFVKRGSGKLVLSDKVLYSGKTTLEEGALQLRLRNGVTSDDGVFVPAQGDIEVTGDETTLVFAQNVEEDVVWSQDLSVSGDFVDVEKTGGDALTISGTTTFSGDAATLTVSAGTLAFTGDFNVAKGLDFVVSTGATLSLARLAGTTADYSATFSGSGALEIAADGTTPVSLSGGGHGVVEPVSANGQGLSIDAFTGTLLVKSGTLELSGESVFDYARGAVVAGGATLAVAAGSQQSLKQIDGAGTLSLSGDLELANDDGVRIAWDWKSAKAYIYDEGKLFSAASFTGTVEGAGTLQIAGQGLTQLQGVVGANVKVADGGQLVIGAQQARDMQSSGKMVTVDGASTYYTDAQGRRVFVSDPADGYGLADVDPTRNAAGNFSTEVVSDREGTFYAASQYVPRNLKASYTDADGKTVNVPVENIVTDATGKLIDRVSRRELTVSATEWDFVPNDADNLVSANWTVLGEDGKTVNPADAIVWDPAQGKFVLGTYEYTDENGDTQTAPYTGGYRWLAEVTDANGAVSFVPADFGEEGTSVSEHTNVSEVVLSANGSESVRIDSGTMEFIGGGRLGKVGDGVVSVSGADIADCGGVNVYEGELKVTSGSGWVFGADNIARVALGAVLTVELDAAVVDDLDFKSVYGSGVLSLVGSGDVTIFNDPDSDESPVLPTYSEDGAFFNGVISFSGESEDDSFSVTVSDVTIPSISTTRDVTLKMYDVTIEQARNSEILSENFYVLGKVLVKGESAASGLATGSAARRLTIDEVEIDTQGEIKLKDIGFGASVDGTFRVVIDKESRANAFYYGLTGDIADGNLAQGGTLIDFESGVRPNDPYGTTKLKSLSLIQSSEVGTTVGHEWTISGEKLSSAGAGDRDEVFGISKNIYGQLATNGGTIYVGVEAGTMRLTNLDGFTGTTANGVNVDLVTLRSSVRASAGTLEIASSGTLSETISGSGNAAFSSLAEETLVTAKQTYLGRTTVSGNVRFSGAGTENHSSRFEVTNTGTFSGGLSLVGRSVSCSGSMLRNMDATGAAGTTTLKLSLSDPRLSESVVIQMEVAGDGTVTSPSVYSESSLNGLGVSVEFVSDEAGAYRVKDGKFEVKITDSAIGETYSLFVPVKVSAFPKKVGETASYASTSLAAETTFVLNGTWKANLAAGDGVSAGRAEFGRDAKIVLEGLNSASALGRTVSLVSASSIVAPDGLPGTTTTASTFSAAAFDDPSASGARGSEIVAAAIRNGGVAEGGEVMVFTGADGSVNVQLIISDFATLGVDYSDGISSSFLGALSEISSFGQQAYRGVLNADTIPLGQDRDLFFALNSLSADELAREVDKLSPNAFASMLAMPASAFASDVKRLHERLDQRRYDGANPLRETGEYEFFALAQSDFAENDTAKDAPIFDYNLYGVSAGFDWKPNFETTLGLALGYTYGKAKIHGGGKIDMDDVRVTAFFGRLFGNVYLDGGVQAGMGSFDSRRATIAGSTKGDTDSLFAGAFLTLGSVFSIWQDKRSGEGLYFTPSVGVSYFRTSIDGFREIGTAGLDTDDMDGDSLRTRVALGLQWVVPGDEWTVRLGVEAAYAHDFLGDEMDADARFAAGGPKFSTTGKALPKDVFSLGPTLDVQISDRDSLWLGYELEIDTDSGVSQGVNAGYRHRF